MDVILHIFIEAIAYGDVEMGLSLEMAETVARLVETIVVELSLNLRNSILKKVILRQSGIVFM